jgi:hypothetical protein
MGPLRRSSFLSSRTQESSPAAAEFISRLSLRLVAGALLLACIPGFLSAQEEFFLKNGDTVVFYGDSITARRIYSSFTEAYVLTRFPKLDVRFVHSGWGGDTVAGGAGGSLRVRLQRDVIAYQPTVVTILLGMNDGRDHLRRLHHRLREAHRDPENRPTECPSDSARTFSLRRRHPAAPVPGRL